MDYEERLHVWCIALKMGMAYWNGRGLLIPPSKAVEELNASPHLNHGGQLRAVQLNEIVAEFKDTAPPYPSFDPRLKLRAEKRRERAAEQAAKHRVYMRERMREKRAPRLADLPAILGSQRHGYQAPRDLGLNR